MWTLVMVIAATASVIRSAPEWHYCYECSGQSALCRESVYDGQYLSKTACSSTCFLRYEGETIYRGCFDGWLGGMVHHEYQGCQVQEYLGEKVEWCFCKGYDEKPCNGESRDFINKLGALEIEETPKNNTSDARSANGVSATANVRNASADVNPGDVNQDKEIPQRLGAPQNFDYQGAGDTNDQLDNDDKTNIFQLSFEDQRKAPLPTQFFPSSPTVEEITVDDGGYGIENAEEVSKMAAKDHQPINPIQNDQSQQRSSAKQPYDPANGISKAQWLCVDEGGSYPDPEDCGAYYQCSHGRPYHMRCGAGTVWNDALKGCSFTYTTAAPCRMPLDFKRLVSIWAGYTPWQYMGYSFNNVATDDPPNYMRNDKKLYETFYGDYNAV